MITERELRTWGETDTPERRAAWESLLLEIDTRISLTPTQYEGLNARYESISEILADPLDAELGDVLVFPQGSVCNRTVIRPPDRDDVDVDAIVYLKGGTRLLPVELLDRLFAELESRVRTGGSVKPSKRCITIQYNDKQLPCHMDLTPAIRRPDNFNVDGSGRLWIPDRPTASWSPSNPRDFSDWFERIAGLEITVVLSESYRSILEKRAETEPLPSHDEITAPNGLRVSVRLMKRHRDVYIGRTRRKETKPISIIITTLAAKAYERVAQRFCGQALSPLQILTEVVAEMPKCFDTPDANERFRLLNPEDQEENFAEKWNSNPQLAATFFDWHSDLEQALRYGYVDFPSRERFRSELMEVFGNSAGRACDEYFAEIRNDVYPGLSAAAARKARVAGQSAALIGLGRSEPTRASEPNKLDRLG